MSTSITWDAVARATRGLWHAPLDAGPAPLATLEEPVCTWANAITTVRAIAVVALAVTALSAHSLQLLVVTYTVYWVLDMADGEVARRMDQETRTGAVFDIVADRVSCLLCGACLVVLNPAVALPVAIYIAQFAVVDTMLSLGFLAFDVKGPNDMHAVDLALWRLNWSKPAKALNTASVILLCITGHITSACLVALLVLGIKIWSCLRLRGLTPGLASAPR